MAKIYGSTVTTPMNPAKFGGSGIPEDAEFIFVGGNASGSIIKITAVVVDEVLVATTSLGEISAGINNNKLIVCLEER